MADPGYESSSQEKEAAQFDQSIEEDIKRLRRSSNMLLLLAALAVVLLVVVVSFRIVQFLSEGRNPDSYQQIMYVINDATVVYEEPDNTSAIVARLTKGESLFQVTKKGDWAKVQKSTITGWVERVNLATRGDLPTRESGEDVPLHIFDVNWIVDEIDNFTIIGKIENMSEVPLKNVKIQVKFYDREEICCDEKGKEHPPIMIEETWVAREVPLVAGVQQKFIITGKYQKNFKKIRYRIVSYE